jgi:hypothetical protein
MAGSANERPNRARQPQATISDSTNADANEVASTANHAGDAAGHGGNATSDRTRSAPNGLHDSSADRGKTPAHPPNYSEREAGSAHEGANQPHPHGSDSSTGTRCQPLEPGADVPAEGDDRTGHPAERVTQAPQHRANRT